MDAYHFHGVEKTFEDGCNKAYDYLKDNPLEATELKSGDTYTLSGGFSYGIGTDKRMADAALYENNLIIT